MLKNVHHLELENTFDNIFDNLVSSGNAPEMVLAEMLEECERAFNEWLDCNPPQDTGVC
jgi:hypothetical protein